MEFEQRQKTKILRCLELGNKNYVEIQIRTSIPLASIRGRMSEIRQKGLIEKKGEKFTITQDGKDFLERGGNIIEVS